MLIEYYASDREDLLVEKALEKFEILEWFNPEDGYYVLETLDERVPTIMSLIGVELYISEKKDE